MEGGMSTLLSYGGVDYDGKPDYTSRNIMVGVIVLYLLYVYVFLPSQDDDSSDDDSSDDDSSDDDSSDDEPYIREGLRSSYPLWNGSDSDDREAQSLKFKASLEPWLKQKNKWLDAKDIMIKGSKAHMKTARKRMRKARRALNKARNVYNVAKRKNKKRKWAIRKEKKADYVTKRNYFKTKNTAYKAEKYVVEGLYDKFLVYERESELLADQALWTGPSGNKIWNGLMW
jgi:hypothetical protein